MRFYNKPLTVIKVRNKKNLRKSWTKYAIDVQIDEEIFARQADIDDPNKLNGGVAEW